MDNSRTYVKVSRKWGPFEIQNFVTFDGVEVRIEVPLEQFVSALAVEIGSKLNTELTSEQLALTMRTCAEVIITEMKDQTRF